MGTPKRGKILAQGAPAPVFALPSLDGGTTALPDLLPSAPLLLVFFKVSCPVCQLTLPVLDRIHRGRAAGSISIIGISQDEAENTRDFNRRFGVGFPVLLDTSRNHYQASDAYGITNVPTLFLVGREGTITRRVEGFVKRDLLDLAATAGLADPFRPGEYVPEWKAG